MRVMALLSIFIFINHLFFIENANCQDMEKSIEKKENENKVERESQEFLQAQKVVEKLEEVQKNASEKGKDAPLAYPVPQNAPQTAKQDQENYRRPAIELDEPYNWQSDPSVKDNNRSFGKEIPEKNQLSGQENDNAPLFISE